MRGTAMVMNRSRNSYMRAPRSVTAQPIAIPCRRLKFAIAFLARVTTACCPVIAASSAVAASTVAPAWPPPRRPAGRPSARPPEAGPREWSTRTRSVLSSRAFLPHPRDRLAGLDRDPLHRPVLVAPASHARGLPRLRVEEHHVGRRDRRRKLDDPALASGRAGRALVLLHDVHALHHDPELLGVHPQDLAFLPAVLAADHAHRVPFGHVQLVALGLAAPLPATLAIDQRPHLRSPPARATRSS